MSRQFSLIVRPDYLTTASMWLYSYDVFHKLGDPDSVLEELHRVLTPDGIMSFSDHHLEEDGIVSRVTGSGLFELSKKGRKTYIFLCRSAPE